MVINSLFGKVLKDVLHEYGITAGALCAECGMRRMHLFDVKNGLGDYNLSVYRRIVSALREFIHDPDGYRAVRQKLMEAAFYDSLVDE